MKSPVAIPFFRAGAPGFLRTFRAAWRPVLWVAGILLTGVSMLLFLWEDGFVGWPERTLHLRGIQPEQGLAFTAKYPPVWPGFVLNSRAAVLRENGTALVPVNHESVVRENGGGTFFARRNRAIFTASDGSDPRSNGRAYVMTQQLRVLPPVRVAVGVLDVAFLLFALWTGRTALMRQAAAGEWFPAVGRSRVLWACAVFAAALAVRIYFLWTNPFYTDGIFSIRGSPFSDARAWYSMARAMADGGGADTGFPGKRPFYGIFLALFYQWSGGGVMLAKGLHALIGAASAAVAFLIFRRFTGLWAAGAAALFFAIDPQQVTQSGQLMTEPLGTLLIMVSAWLLIAAGPRLARWPIFGAGVAFGLSNLTRPLTLFGFPLFLLLIGVHAFRTARGLRATILPMSLFALGTALCIGPWVVRQHAVHGIWSISDNTASGLYAASTPEFGRWQVAAEERSSRAGIPYTVKDRYDFFQRGFRENLEKYPGFYWRNVLGSILPAAAAGSIVTPAFREAGVLALAVVALLALRRRAWATLVATGLACAALACLDAATGRRLALAGLALTLWRAPFPAAVLAATYASALLGSALFGNPVLFRMRYLIDWMETGWLCLALLQGSRFAAGLVLRAPARHLWESGETRGEISAGLAAVKGLHWAGWAAGVFIAISGLRLIALNTFLPPAPPPDIVLTRDDLLRLAPLLSARAPVLKPLVKRIRKGPPEGDALNAFTRIVWLGDCQYSFPASLDIHHGAEIFLPRPGAFSVVEMFRARHPYRDNPIMGFFPGELPRAWLGRRCIAVGLSKARDPRVPDSFQTVELFALLPGTEITPEAVGHALLAPIVPRTQAMLDALPQPSAPPP